MKSGSRIVASLIFIALLAPLCACQSSPSPFNLARAPATAAPIRLSFSGSNEIPPVATLATGSGTITVNDDRTVRGIVTLTGVVATAAQVHEGAPGVEGAAVLDLDKTSDSTFGVPAGSRLTESQFEKYKAGGLYINVRSAAHPDGEVRATLAAG